MRLSLDDAPTNPVVSLADMKLYLKIETEITDEDDLIESLVKAATKQVENYCRIALITQTWDVYYDLIGDKIELPRPPLQKINTFKYYDDDYTAYDMTATLYITQTFARTIESGYIRRKKYESWPTYTENGDGIKINFDCGFGDDATDVPEDLVDAVKKLAVYKYDNRGSTDIPENILDIIDMYKVYFPG